MSKQALTTQQKLALVLELETAVKLSQGGIVALHELSGANNFFHLPMQLLAQGLERLLKVSYALAVRERTGELPAASLFRKRYGHDLVTLTKDLVDLASKEPSYARRPAVQADLTFIRTDDDLSRVLRLLTSFGQRSRYHQLEAFLDPSSVSPEDDPDNRWRELELEVLERNPDWLEQLSSADQHAAAYKAIYIEIARPLDRFTRAIAWMWTLGALGDEAPQYLGIISSFVFLDDDGLGQPRQS